MVQRQSPNTILHCHDILIQLQIHIPNNDMQLVMGAEENNTQIKDSKTWMVY